LILFEARDEPAELDVAKASVIAEIDWLVVAAVAVLVILEAGAQELHLASGEIFLLGEKTITRIG
jgi:hypothetical protein